MVITQLLGEWELRIHGGLAGGVSRPVGAQSRPDVQMARERAVQRLAMLGPVGLEPLARLLRAERGTALDLRRAVIAALALGRMGDVRVMPALVEALGDQREEYAPVRAAVAGALGQLKAEGAATIYERARSNHSADDWQSETVLLGAVRLEAVAEALVTALGDPAAEVRAAAAGAFIDLCLGDTPQVAPAGGAPGPSGAKAGGGGQAPARIALHGAVAPLIAALKDRTISVRVNAAAALGWIGDQRAAAPLIRCLKDTDERCRCAAALALGMLRAPAALKPLARAMADPSSQVRLHAAEALRELADPVTGDLLVDVLNDQEEPLEVRAAAARALGSLRLQSAFEPLHALLAAPEPILRAATVEALGLLGFGRAYRLLTPFLWHDPDQAVRHAAARAVARLAEGRQGRARWRLRLALRVGRQARREALLVLEQQVKRAHQAPLEKNRSGDA